MEISSSLLFFIAGLFILIFSSNWLIQGSVKLSNIFKLTPLFVGMVIIAFGTSCPEAGLGIMAAIRNQKDLALGNIIGSNIANIGLVLGLCSLFKPLKVNKSIFKRELPIMLFSVVLFYVLSRDLLLDWTDGLIFIFCFIVFCFISYRTAKKSFDHKEIEAFKLKKVVKNLNSRFAVFGVIILSLAGVVLGADLMVKGGVSLARVFGISPWIIGITVFAIGTSLPELVTSLTASFKKVSSISVGNVVGSNIFNILFVLGIVSLIRPISLEVSTLGFELPVLLGFSFFLFIIMRIGYKITRWEGLVLFLGYLGFLIFLLKK
jgi:cation:H+ antiporter